MFENDLLALVWRFCHVLSSSHY